MQLGDLFNETQPYKASDSDTQRLNGGSSSGARNRELSETSNYLIQHIDGNKRTGVDLYYGDGFLIAVAYETLNYRVARPPGSLGRPLSPNLERKVSARVNLPFSVSVESFIDITRQLAGLLREEYWNSYNAYLDAPLEDLLISICCVQPIYPQ